MASPLERNIVRYRQHQRVAGALFWMPVVVLYLMDEVGLARALQIQAVYYVAVVLLEVPSGWASDRLSRVATIRAASVAWLVAHALFLTGSTPALVAAQVMLAAGYAFLSGTDVTFHFDTLEALDRADEFETLEALGREGLLLVTAGTALTGGALAFVDLRLPFVAALIAAAVQLAMAMRLVEPPRSTDHGALGADLVATVRHLRDPLLGWLAVYLASQVIVVHLAAEFTGPYLAVVLDRPVSEPAGAALLAGVVAAAVATVGALGVRSIRGVVARLGLPATLMIAAAVPVLVLSSMALVTSLALLPLLALRGLQGAATSVLAPSIVGGRVERHHRATFLSMTSLGGRLGHVGVLLLIAPLADGSVADALSIAALVAAALWSITAIARSLVGDFPTRWSHDHDHDHPAIRHDHLHRHGDGHHGHVHDPPVTGVHTHVHSHDAMRHAHPHTRDAHHGHDHY